MTPRELADAIRIAKTLPKPPPQDAYREKRNAKTRETMRRIRAERKKTKL